MSVIGPLMLMNHSIQTANKVVTDMNKNRNAKSNKNGKSNPMFNGNPKQMKGNPKGFNSTKVNRSFKSGS